MAFMEQRQPQYLDLRNEPRALAEVLAALGITPEQLLPGLWPTRVNTGASFVMVPLNDEAHVAAIVPDQAELARLSEQFELIGFYVFSLQTREPGRDAGARMFAPRYGINEESATGMAAGPLACFLHDYLGVPGPRLLIEQGYLMRPPSASMITVDLQLAEGRIERLLAGGKAQVMSELALEL
jgi:PhzF family phenazine biosynthesis protein